MTTERSVVIFQSRYSWFTVYVVSIENYAFANCKNLKTIEIRTMKLKNKKISSKAFKKINKKVVIRVLKKQRKAYKTLLRKKGLSKANKFKAL